MKELNVSFVWHMHQPLYKDNIHNTYLMPWVRLHAIKDYLDMAVILEDFPNIKQTFNFVPSLIEQIEDYASEKANDPYLKLSQITVDKLSNKQKIKILKLFFDLNWERMIYKYPRYNDILQKRENLRKKYNDDYDNFVDQFSNQEILDLIVWFNLSWFDYIWQKQEKELIYLIDKGRDFTEQDREIVLSKQLEIIRKIIPEYKKLVQEGKVELTTTPYYHPILPLLCNTDSAKVARPNLNLPENNYSHCEDAKIQIKKAIEKHISCFGQAPKGMWPSEQSVSPAILPYIQENDINWIISDEGILFNSINYYPHRDRDQIFEDPTVLYQPYLLEEGNRKVTIIFRDINISDAIGFVYSKMHPYDAAKDLYIKLKKIQQRLPDDQPYLVTIALDGENCWEHYLNDGYDFLYLFYEMVENDDSINMTTVSNYLEKNPPRRVINKLFSGSWIRSDFTTWIGEPTKNKAWDCLYQARKELVDFQAKNPENENLKKAWEEIYIAEGSDWFWWFGEGNSSSHDDLFDWQFRLHLQNVYNLINIYVPDILKNGLYDTGKSNYLPDSFIEKGWLDGKIYNFGTHSGTMHQSGKFFGKIYYGHDKSNFKIKLDHSLIYEYSEKDYIEIFIKTKDEGQTESINDHVDENFKPNFKVVPKNINLPELDYEIKHCIFRFTHHKLKKVSINNEFMEFDIPLKELNIKKGETVSFIIIAYKNNRIEELIPEPIEYLINS
ncbi:MAG: glycoside hydrolase [Candidatus Sericytochromatia bacterium]|nr:glycoside hydrolase [Candidatus Sericytochromatia bacterium]